MLPYTCILGKRCAPGASLTQAKCPPTMKVTGMSLKKASSSLRCGPSPTKASRLPGMRSMTPLIAVRFFSAGRVRQ